MISIVVCSVNPILKDQFICNVESSVGVPVEFLIHDNRETKWGIGKVYNYYAERARYDILCFAHEDVAFLTDQWGKVVVDFLNQTPNAGVVGFAGSTMKSKVQSGWTGLSVYRRAKLTQYHKTAPPQCIHVPASAKDFEEVVCLDGLCLMTTKEVWKKDPFDEINFPGFHLYDLSFSFKISLSRRNYVCYLIEIAHFSEGSFSKEWYESSMRFHSVWKDYLPRWLDNNVSEKKKQEVECRTAYFMAKEYILVGVFDRSVGKIVRNLFRETHSIKYCVKYLYWVYAKRGNALKCK